MDKKSDKDPDGPNGLNELKTYKMIEFFKNYTTHLENYYSGQKWCEIRKRVCKCPTPCWQNRYRIKYYKCTLNKTELPSKNTYIHIKDLLEASDDSETLSKETIRNYIYLYNILESTGVMSKEYLVTGEIDIIPTLLETLNWTTIILCLNLLCKWTLLLPINDRESLISLEMYIKFMTLNNIANKYRTIVNKECIDSSNWVTIDNIRTLLRVLRQKTESIELYTALKLFVDYCPVRGDFGNLWVFRNSEKFEEFQSTNSDTIKGYVDIDSKSIVFIERNKSKDYNVQSIEGIEEYIWDYTTNREGSKLFSVNNFAKWFRMSLKREFNIIGVKIQEPIGVRMLRKVIASSNKNLDIYKRMGHNETVHNNYYVSK